MSTLTRSGIPPADIRIGDVGTVYFVPTYDDDTALTTFDPTSATTKQLIFKMPGASGLCVRDATPAQRTIGGSTVYGLEYTVLAADVVAYANVGEGGFHQAAGNVEIEAYLGFSDDQKWASSVVKRDYRGRPLAIVARLTV